MSLRTCPQCQSKNINQISSILIRLLLSCYIFLSFLFFTGSIFYESLLALIPFVIPYKNKCQNCNITFVKVLPQFSKASVFGENTKFLAFLVGILPSILIITLLITFFPNTGLGRIIYLPFIFIINSIIIVSNFSSVNKTNPFFKWGITIIFTLLLTIVFYPQENGPHVVKQIYNYLQ
jgi:hypothetical protein